LWFASPHFVAAGSYIIAVIQVFAMVDYFELAASREN
jgi:hypothetical protein